MKATYSRCVIVGAAKINDYVRAKSFLRPGDFYIFCDAGLSHEGALGVRADLIVGDFDSHAKPDRLETQIITLPRAKDDTDSFYAVKEALRRGFKNFLLLGVFGQRLDHTFVNISALVYLYEKGADCLAVDDYSAMHIVGKEPVEVSKGCVTFSLVPVCGRAAGISITGAKFPLDNGEVDSSYIYTSSNEVLEGQIARVHAREGLLLLIENL